MPEIPVPDTGTLAETEKQTALSERIPAPAEELTKPEKPKKKGEELLMTVLMVFSSLLGIALAVVLFMWLPSFFSKWLGEVFPVMNQAGCSKASWKVCCASCCLWVICWWCR